MSTLAGAKRKRRHRKRSHLSLTVKVSTLGSQKGKAGGEGREWGAGVKGMPGKRKQRPLDSLSAVSVPASKVNDPQHGDKSLPLSINIKTHTHTGATLLSPPFSLSNLSPILWLMVNEDSAGDPVVSTIMTQHKSSGWSSWVSSSFSPVNETNDSLLLLLDGWMDERKKEKNQEVHEGLWYGWLTDCLSHRSDEGHHPGTTWRRRGGKTQHKKV